MLFNTFQFAIFFAVVFGLFQALPGRQRWILLLVASIYFYAAYKPINVLLLFVTLIVDYCAGRLIERSTQPWHRALVIAASLCTNLGILFTFKYLGFAMQTLNRALEFAGFPGGMDPIHLDLPVGISFYTFQSMSYVIDASRGQVKVERTPFRYFAYVSLFPQLVAGPIERASHLLPQFHREPRTSFERIRSGLQIALWGMFKKVVIADSFAVVVETVYSDPEKHNGLGLLVGTIFFAIQIYCDFSGYSDIAIGVAKILGFDLMTNFRQPYLARSIADFWQRWHISLSTWFRDYVYIPIGGNRVGLLRWAFNVMVVFTLSGMWHGAKWTFLIWGGLHGSYFLIGRLTERPIGWLFRNLGVNRVPGLVAFLEWFAVMIMVLIGWVFFRARSVGEAVYILTNSLDFSDASLGQLFALGLPRFEMALSFFWIFFLMASDAVLYHKPAWATRLWQNRIFRHLCYQFLFFAIALFGVFEEVEFIYFAF